MINILGTNINSNMRLILSLSSFLISFILSLLLTKLHYSFGTFVYNIILFVVIYMLAILVYNQINTSLKTKNSVKESFGNKLSEDELDELNQYISEKVVESREALLVTTILNGQTVLRMCLINPRTRWKM